MKVIDFENASCKHCYKCVRSCSVKAIRVRQGQAQIMTEDCVLCGHCLEVCPQNAKTFASDLERVKGYLAAGMKTVVSIAPSYLGILQMKQPGQVVDALLRLGFDQVRETAEGAAYVTEAYRKLMAEGEMKHIISTCCTSVNDLVEKYYPELIPYMAPVVSPMVAHGRLIKALYGPETKVVFLGPCIAKKEEAEGDDRTEGAVDAVINFTEFTQWCQEADIDLQSCENKPFANSDPKINRLYPVSGGVISSVLNRQQTKADAAPVKYRQIFVDGIENCRELFDSLLDSQLKPCFIEANICEGGCIKGPAVDKLDVSRFKAKLDIEASVLHESPDYPRAEDQVALTKHFYSRANIQPEPSEEEIQKILKATGKYNKTQELNCGACGYPTCREKAIAVCLGKAELDMCLPFAFEKAQNMSNVVMTTTPNLIMIVDADMRIKEFNRRAEDVFKLSRPQALEMFIFELMDHTDFEHVLHTRNPIYRRKVEWEDPSMTLLETMVYVEGQEQVLAIFQDITEDEKNQMRQYTLKMDTVEIAQKVIDKQMMVAQEIAGLLGETTAETKVILTKLRDSILADDDTL